MDFYDRQGNKISPTRWGELFQRRGYRRIAIWGQYSGDVRAGEIPREDELFVSTAWRGYDASFIGQADPPLIFETAVFTSMDAEPARVHYPTEAEAIGGHNVTVQNIVNGEPLWFEARK